MQSSLFRSISSPGLALLSVETIPFPASLKTPSPGNDGLPFPKFESRSASVEDELLLELSEDELPDELLELSELSFELFEQRLLERGPLREQIPPVWLAAPNEMQNRPVTTHVALYVSTQIR